MAMTEASSTAIISAGLVVPRGLSDAACAVRDAAIVPWMHSTLPSIPEGAPRARHVFLAGGADPGTSADSRALAIRGRLAGCGIGNSQVRSNRLRVASVACQLF
jgi:hypothetical protein